MAVLYIELNQEGRSLPAKIYLILSTPTEIRARLQTSAKIRDLPRANGRKISIKRTVFYFQELGFLSLFKAY